MDVRFQIIGIIFFIVFLIGAFWLVIRLIRLYESKHDKDVVIDDGVKRKHFLIEKLHQPIEYVRSYKQLTVDDQRLINAVLQQPPEENLRDYIRANGWNFGRFANDVGTYASFYSFDLAAISFEILMRKTGYSSSALRFFMQIIEKQQLLYVEGMVDKDYDVFSPKGLSLEAMTILSPEVLETLHAAPRNATILIKRDKLFYIVYGSSKPEEDYDKFALHAAKAIPELNDNIGRFARTDANKKIIAKSAAQPVGMSDEEYYSQSKGKYFTRV